MANFLSHDSLLGNSLVVAPWLHPYQNGGSDPRMDLRKDMDLGSDSPAEDQLNFLFCVWNEIKLISSFYRRSLFVVQECYS